MRKFFSLISVLLLLLAVFSLAVACSSGSTENPEKSAVRAYADPATETTLEGLSENNLAKYVENGSAAFKAAVTQEILDATAAQIKTQLGNYVSKEFLSTEEQDGYIIVYYKVKFTAAEVGVRMVFDQEHKVSGQWFE